jgi:hypothetical protein
MTRVVLLLGSLGALVCVAGWALFGATTALGTSGTSFAVGGFQGPLAGGANQNIAFSAHNSGGGDVVGRLSETLTSPGEDLSTLRGEVDCLVVSGGRAAVGYVVLESSGVLALSMPVGSRQTLLVQDSDQGDTFAFGFFPDCADAISIEPIFPIAGGNIIVRS